MEPTPTTTTNLSRQSLDPQALVYVSLSLFVPLLVDRFGRRSLASSGLFTETLMPGALMSGGASGNTRETLIQLDSRFDKRFEEPCKKRSEILEQCPWQPFF